MLPSVIAWTVRLTLGSLAALKVFHWQAEFGQPATVALWLALGMTNALGLWAGQRFYSYDVAAVSR